MMDYSDCASAATSLNMNAYPTETSDCASGCSCSPQAGITNQCYWCTAGYTQCTEAYPCVCACNLNDGPLRSGTAEYSLMVMLLAFALAMF